MIYFDALYPRFEGKIAEIPKSQKPAKQSRPESEILEELVSGIRNVEGRLRDVVDDGRKTKINRSSQYASRIALDLADRLSDGPGDTIRLVIIASVLRDEFPWLFDLVYDLHKSNTLRPSRRNHLARRKVANAIESLMYHPLAAECGIDRHLLQVLMHEVPFFGGDRSPIDLGETSEETQGELAEEIDRIQ